MKQEHKNKQTNHSTAEVRGKEKVIRPGSGKHLHNLQSETKIGNEKA